MSSHEGFDGLVARHPTAHHMVSNGFRYSFQSRGERQQLSFIRILDQARLSPRFAKDDVLRLQVVQNVPAKRSRLLNKNELSDPTGNGMNFQNEKNEKNEKVHFFSFFRFFHFFHSANLVRNESSFFSFWKSGPT